MDFKTKLLGMDMTVVAMSIGDGVPSRGFETPRGTVEASC